MPLSFFMLIFSSGNKSSFEYLNSRTSSQNHPEIRKRAKDLLEKGKISREEYAKIIHADMKYRESTEVFSCKLSTFQFADQLQDAGCSIDPITLEALGENTIALISSTGNQTKYNIESLVNYLISTGDFRDPMCRLPLNFEDLSYIDFIATGLNLPKLTEAAMKIEYYENRRRSASEVCNLEACLGIIITEIMKIVESFGSYENAENTMTLLFSEFDIPFQELKRLNIDLAYQSWSSWISFLRGPKLRPTKENKGRLQLAIKYLEAQWVPKDQEILEAYRQKVGSLVCPEDVLQEMRHQHITNDNVKLSSNTSAFLSIHKEYENISIDEL